MRLPHIALKSRLRKQQAIKRSHDQYHDLAIYKPCLIFSYQLNNTVLLGTKAPYQTCLSEHNFCTTALPIINVLTSFISISRKLLTQSIMVFLYGNSLNYHFRYNCFVLLDHLSPIANTSSKATTIYRMNHS